MNRMKAFSIANPTGDAPGMEPVRLDVLKAAVENTAQPQGVLPPNPQTPAILQAHLPASAIPLINKNIRLPTDLVEFVDYVYTKENRLKKQDAYTHALEAFFRPLMRKA